MVADVKIFVTVALGALLAGAACAKQAADREDVQGEDVMPAQTIEEVLSRHTDSLMSLEGVVGTAIGECEGKPCIRVLVVEKTAELLQKIPSTLEGFVVDVQETGEIRALDPT